MDLMYVLVEHYHRAGDLWTYRTHGPGATIALDSLGVTLAVDEIYAKVRLPRSDEVMDSR